MDFLKYYKFADDVSVELVGDNQIECVSKKGLKVIVDKDSFEELMEILLGLKDDHFMRNEAFSKLKLSGMLEIDDKYKGVVCESCNSIYKAGTRYCMSCGASLDKGKVICGDFYELMYGPPVDAITYRCTKCGYEWMSYSEEKRFCCKCGAKAEIINS